MNRNCEHTSFLSMRNGTAQEQRFITMLDPDQVTLHELTVEDWMRFAFSFSKQLKYYDTATNEVVGDWEAFFLNEEEIKTFVSKIQEIEEGTADSADITPHLTLFAAFLKLTSYSQQRLNGITKRHLDFYYKEVLQLRNKEAKPDKVHLLFELAKKITTAQIPKATPADGGKDSTGEKRIYITEEERVINDMKVAEVRTVYHDEGSGIRQAGIANSYDGIGGDFPDDDIRWWPFGYPSDTRGATQQMTVYPDLPFAKLGFGIASPVLQLKEGKRRITIVITLSEIPTGHSFSITTIGDAVAVFFSGEKEWIPGTIIVADSSFEAGVLTLVIELDEGKEAIVGYDKAILEEPYTTTDPVVRFLVNAQATANAGYVFQQLFAKTKVTQITISVSVSEIQDVVLENDLGMLDASKPFYPFGPQPKKDAGFFIGASEILDKNWESISIKAQWKDLPDDFSELYTAYRTEFEERISKAFYTLTLDDNGNLQEGELTRIVDNKEHFTTDIKVLHNGVWKEAAGQQLFADEWTINSSIQFEEPLPLLFMENMMWGVYPLNKFGQVQKEPKKNKFQKNRLRRKSTPQQFSASVKKGFIRITSNESFLHEMYPRIFSVALSKESSQEVLIPNAPYTPMIEQLRLGYSATASSSDQEVTLFHEHPFGISEETQEVKENSVASLSNQVIRLVPAYKKGSLFIAIENGTNLQQLSLLVQVLEGSENPETTNEFEEEEKLEWSVLCDNEWLSLHPSYVLSNTTDNFLKTGVVTLTIPKEATKENTKFPEGYFWIRVDNPKDYDTISQLIDIQAQVATAVFSPEGNSLEHLTYGLPAETISKLTERLVTIKGITQPFNSFDGKPEETDRAFYRRISERLRHKNRAISQWDYEHLILEAFPDIYRVNCLRHTSQESFKAPGEVTLVVIPNSIQKNVYDPYKPRISKAKRNEIQQFINTLNTLHVTAAVINPVYEEVRVILKAKFYKGKDDFYYTIQLQKDIAKLFAPWAFEETAAIDFGVTLHESSVINYIEKLSYLDYITDFQLQKQVGVAADGSLLFETVKKVSPTTPKGILTSVKYQEHQVRIVEHECPV